VEAFSPSRSFFRLGVDPRRRRRLFRALPIFVSFLLRMLWVCFELEAMTSLSFVPSAIELNTSNLVYGFVRFRSTLQDFFDLTGAIC
jgi:hypothetical protein